MIQIHAYIQSSMCVTWLDAAQALALLEGIALCKQQEWRARRKNTSTTANQWRATNNYTTATPTAATPTTTTTTVAAATLTLRRSPVLQGLVLDCLRIYFVLTLESELILCMSKFWSFAMFLLSQRGTVDYRFRAGFTNLELESLWKSAGNHSNERTSFSVCRNRPEGQIAQQLRKRSSDRDRWPVFTQCAMHIYNALEATNMTKAPRRQNVRFEFVATCIFWFGER